MGQYLAVETEEENNCSWGKEGGGEATGICVRKQKKGLQLRARKGERGEKEREEGDSMAPQKGRGEVTRGGCWFRLKS